MTNDILTLLGRGGVERVSCGMLRLLTVYSRRGGASVKRHVTFVDSLLGRGGVERVSNDMLRLLTVYSVEAGWSECHTACYVC